MVDHSELVRALARLDASLRALGDTRHELGLALERAVDDLKRSLLDLDSSEVRSRTHARCG